MFSPCPVLCRSRSALADQLHLKTVPDTTIVAIDRFFDLVDRGVSHVDRVLNRGKQTAEQHRARRARRSDIISTEATAKPSASAPTVKSASARGREVAPQTATALARRPRFYIVESIAESGIVHFVVTDGGNARATCPTRAFAERLLQALEKAP